MGVVPWLIVPAQAPQYLHWVGVTAKQQLETRFVLCVCVKALVSK